jgi:hypothetical protein
VSSEITPKAPPEEAHHAPAFGALSDDGSTLRSSCARLRGTKKFAVLAVTAKRMDVGLKLKGDPVPELVEGRLAPSGIWNAMVTHRVQLTAPYELDAELATWLRAAYDRV